MDNQDNHEIENHDAVSHDDRAFTKSLETLTPSTTSLSISQTFYRAGFAAALAQSQPVAMAPSADSPPSTFRTMMSLAAAVLIGLSGYFVGTLSQQDALNRSPTDSELAMPSLTISVEELQQPVPEPPAVTLQPNDLAITPSRSSTSVRSRSPFMSFLIPRQVSGLSLGSLGLQDAQRIQPWSATEDKPNADITLTAKPAVTKEFLKSLLAP